MRKKKIIEQNAELFRKIEELQGRVNELNSALEEKTEKLKKAEKEIEELKNAGKTSSPIEEVKEKVTKNILTTEEYGAKAIGKIVVNATKATGDVSGNPHLNTIETVNLILGKAEVAKAEILNVVSSSEEDNQKRIKIDSIVEKCCDYFSEQIK